MVPDPVLPGGVPATSWPSRRGRVSMPFFARTPRRTWLLAAAVWFGLCGIAWTILPARPRAAFSAEHERPVQFSADGRLLLTHDFGTFSSTGRRAGAGWPTRDDFPNGPFHVRDLATGECVATWPRDDRSVGRDGPGPGRPMGSGH